MRFNSRHPDQWRELFDAASAFHNLAPWQWMSDDMVFGVKDPATGTTGYCCVLGAPGTLLALNVQTPVREPNCNRRNIASVAS